MSKTDKPLVLSPHLVSPKGAELSEFEFAMIVCWNAFTRWLEKGASATDAGDMTFIDVVVLHQLKHRAKNKKVADICFVLNFDDVHVVTYSLKKLVAAGLAIGEKVGKEVLYRTTEAGEAAIENYRQIREQCLMSNVDESMNAHLRELANSLGNLSSLYERAARSASSLR
ncbi:winged helix DNA-binding protein [Allopusillimonas ginsengisoli]|uniref:winged helix DNA-binding protein n=1 Tax=Allopusillimonas ginsengisoli TaxID=453575 RepID=UPI001020D04E|nr:winged helix DNA-binding protein [Allopusillimonas ginsengisoli]TEA71954.1 transcriptional regulator [Allopusillimonas ginsengisoli]